MTTESERTDALKLPGTTSIGSVTLNVADLDRTLELYEGVLGLANGTSAGDGVALSPPGGKWPLLCLRKAAGESASARRSAGLYHVAYLLPSRAALGALLSRIIASGYPIQGAADHIVSEAVYLADPEGNGIELYTDRPRSAWAWTSGQVAMATEPLDLQSLIEEGARTWPSGQAIHAETSIGHVHLQIGDLRRGEDFYNGQLGFDVTQRSYPGALFLSAGGYHHHIGLNVWGGRGIPPRHEGERGLESFSILVPDAAAFRAIAGSRSDQDSSGPGKPRVRLHDSDGIAVDILGPHA